MSNRCGFDQIEIVAEGAWRRGEGLAQFDHTTSMAFALNRSTTGYPYQQSVGKVQDCNTDHPCDHSVVTIWNVRSTGSAVWMAGATVRPHCHATTVTSMRSFARTGTSARRRVLRSTTAGPALT